MLLLWTLNLSLESSCMRLLKEFTEFGRVVVQGCTAVLCKRTFETFHPLFNENDRIFKQNESLMNISQIFEAIVSKPPFEDTVLACHIIFPP